MAVTSAAAKRFVHQVFCRSRKSRISRSAKGCFPKPRGRLRSLPELRLVDWGRLKGLKRAEFLFSALDFIVSSGCGLLDFMLIAFLACEMPKID
jgi:hypothetical protein